ncbi:restriction endonuclease subunit S [Clostridium butyricum]|uniref:restriction endonuclease subunit S n=1 Tax=Clostridium butyricum TaxID=1492 RepID=UPI00374E8483
MGLTKYRIGDLISIVDEKNKEGLKSFYGININKEFMPTIANTDNLDEKKYKIVRKNRFVFSGMQTGRDECIRISMYTEDTPIIVSPAYTTFEVSDTDKILPTYLYMMFLSKEKDRLGWFYSDSSVRANLDWDVFCDIEIKIPLIEIQQKYVDIYNAMLVNQRAYETGLEDLRLTCEIEIDKIKHTAQKIPTGKLLENVDVRNADGNITTVQGINITKNFMPSVASVAEGSLKNYKVVQKGQFAYSSMQTGRDECIRIALMKEYEPIIVSPAYSVLQVKNDEVLAEYIMMWFSRSESDRYGWFASDGSIRANLDLDRFYEIDVPVPDIKVQEAIVEIYNAYLMRRDINEKLKSQIKDLCPILIKGALEEAKK